MNADSEQRQIGGALTEDVLRHRLDAVDVAAEINAIEVQLENLLFRQALLDHQREDRFLALAEPVAARGGEKQRARELLRQRAAAFFESAGPHVADDGPADGNGIDADMRVESMIFDRDDARRAGRRRCGSAARRADALRAGTTPSHRRRRTSSGRCRAPSLLTA